MEYRADITQLHYEDKARLLRGDLLPLPPETVVEDLRHSPYKLLVESQRWTIKRALEKAQDCAVTQDRAHFISFIQHLNDELDYEGKPDADASRALLVAEIETLREILADDLTLLQSGAADEAVIKTPTSPTLLALLDSYVLGQTHLTPAYVEAIRAAVREFIEICGDKPVSDYRRSDAAAFRETLLLTPANWKKKPELRQLDIRQAAQLAKQLGMPRQKAKTIREKWFKLFTVFEFARSTCDGIAQFFESKSLRVSDKVAHNEQKAPFQREELHVLLSSPLPGNLYWLTWLGLYVGARLNELCQLTKAHVKCHQDIWYIHFSKELQLKTGETESCVRSVPLHTDLLKLGFLEFVAASSGPLFPGLKKSEKTGRLSDIPSKRFTHHLKRLRLKRDTLSYHSLRHTFAMALKRVPSCDVETRERLLGHAVGGMAQRYGGGYEAEAEDFELLLKRAMVVKQVRFEGFPRSAALGTSGIETVDELTHRPS